MWVFSFLSSSIIIQVGQQNQQQNTNYSDRKEGDRMANTRIKEALKNKNMKQWQLAKLIGINEFSLSRKLREELDDEETEKMLTLIEEGSENDD